MGILTDLILATEAELAALDPEEIPINVLPGLEIKGTTLVEMGTLLAIATGRDFEAGLEAFPMVSGQDSEEGPWVLRCSPELIAVLAAADAQELARVSAEWAKTEEIEGLWEPDEVHERILEMHEFARTAVAAGKPVHIWTSL